MHGARPGAAAITRSARATSPTPLEADFDGAEEAYRRAAEIAEKLDDKRVAGRREAGARR